MNIFEHVFSCENWHVPGSYVTCFPLHFQHFLILWPQWSSITRQIEFFEFVDWFCTKWGGLVDSKKRISWDGFVDCRWEWRWGWWNPSWDQGVWDQAVQFFLEAFGGMVWFRFRRWGIDEDTTWILAHTYFLFYELQVFHHKKASGDQIVCSKKTTTTTTTTCWDVIRRCVGWDMFVGFQNVVYRWTC